MLRFESVFLPIVLAAPLAGCAPTGVGRADATTQSMAELETYLTGSKDTLDGALTSLEEVTKSAAANPRPAYQKFCRGVADIESAAETARSRSIAMTTRAKEHHDRWLKELSGISSEEVRGRAEARHNKALASFQALDTQMADVKAAYEPFIGLMKDIRAYLANDLSASGIAAIGGQAHQATEHGHAVESKIERLVGEIAKVREEWEISTPTPQPASGAR